MLYVIRDIIKLSNYFLNILLRECSKRRWQLLHSFKLYNQIEIFGIQMQGINLDLLLPLANKLQTKIGCLNFSDKLNEYLNNK